jgi:hypothetical protein
MEAAMTIQNNQIPKPSESEGGCLPMLVRMIWIFLGNAALMFCAIYIAMRKAPVLADIIFFLLAIGLVGIRFIDIRVFKGETSENVPATLKDWRRYTIRILIVAGVLYIMAKIAAHFTLI